LPGDTIRAAADLNVPMVAVTLLHRKGYFHQSLDANGWQTEEPVEWVVEDSLIQMPSHVAITIEDRTIKLRSWRYEVRGVGGYTIPIYFLDTDVSGNSDYDRTLTDFLYGGDQYYRLCQEVVLGIGGVRMLRALGYEALERFHMNEGHASLLVLELLDEAMLKAKREAIADEDIEIVRKQCVFTTHTPVPAGHDKFPMDLVIRVLGWRKLYDRKDVFCCEGALNMTYLALNLSHYVNGVAKRHGEVSQVMFGHYVIDAITNGVHAATWVSDAFAKLYDRYIADWKQDNFGLRYALSIPKAEIWEAHTKAKMALISYANRETNSGLDDDVLTIGFARRATPYKRSDLLLMDLERLRSIVKTTGPFQILFAGKAHPHDREGKELIERIFASRNALRKEIRIAYLSHYDIDIARLMVSGSDVWLNTPQPPMEASGTSGMKAALNGVPSLSILDGWWIEGHIEGVTGWSIGEAASANNNPRDRANDAASLGKTGRACLPRDPPVVISFVVRLGDFR
jgi:starch phosphorylase